MIDQGDMTVKERPEIRPAEGRLGVLLPGMGAVATTTIAGVLLARKGLATPVGSLTQMNTIRLGQRTENRTPLIKDFIGLAELDDIVFGGWDPIPDNTYESAVNAGVLSAKHLDPIKDELKARTQRAIDLGIFGVPSYLVDGELFWGQDRLHFVAEAINGTKTSQLHPWGENHA